MDIREIDNRKELVVIFNRKYEATTGKRNPQNWGMMMNLLSHKFVVADEATGEIFIEYPTADEFEEQVDGFFNDEWSAKKCGYFFGYFCKRYGSFVRFDVKVKPEEDVFDKWVKKMEEKEKQNAIR